LLQQAPLRGAAAKGVGKTAESTHGLLAWFGNGAGSLSFGR
jgi:hypothetical protein